MWDYVYLNDEDKSKVYCLLCFDDDKKSAICQNTRTIAGHLSSIHKVVKPDNKPAETSQLTLTKDRENDFKKYAIEHKPELDKYLALAIATSTASNIFCQNKYFRKFIESLNSFYKVPSRNQISDSIQHYIANALSQCSI